MQGEVVVETSNDKLAVVKEDNEAHGWDNVIERCNTWIALKIALGLASTSSQRNHKFALC